jgi:predicted PurR-regulated permease PerM
MPQAHREARFLIAAVIAISALALFVALPYLNTMTLAVVIGITFTPVYHRIRRFIRREGLAALATLTIALVLVVTPLAFFSYQAAGEAVSVYNLVTEDHTVGELAASSVPLAAVAKYLPPSLQDALPASIDLNPIFQSVDRIGSFFGVVTTFTLHLFLLLVGTYYVIKDGGRFVDYLIKLAPIEPEYEDTLFKKLHASVISVVRGSLMLAIIQGVIAGLGFFALGVPNSALWGAATAVASLVPIVGTALVIIPAVLYLLATGSFFNAGLLALWGLLVVGMVDNVLRGQLMKKGMDIHPFLILLSVLGGLEFFGPIGFISGPLLLAILASLLDIYISYRDRYDRALDAPGTLKP